MNRKRVRRAVACAFLALIALASVGCTVGVGVAAPVYGGWGGYGPRTYGGYGGGPVYP
jgi:hypothetical protein